MNIIQITFILVSNHIIKETLICLDESKLSEQIETIDCADAKLKKRKGYAYFISRPWKRATEIK